MLNASCIYLTGVSDYEKGACEGPCTDAAADVAEAAVDAAPKCPSDMVFIDGGRYEPAGKPGSGTVSIAPLCVDATEVTESAYRACVATRNCTAPSPGIFCNYGVPGRENDPMNCVPYAQAKAFCTAAGKRLPTEDEWEWVARGGPFGYTYPWGTIGPAPTDDPERLCWQGKTAHNTPTTWPTRPAGTCPVQSFATGARDGIFDLAGNVWEWTSTAASTTSLIIRGGSAFDPPDATTYTVSASKVSPATGYSGVGFRCFKSAS